MKGKGRKGRQKKKWEDNNKKWTGMDFASANGATGDRTRWRLACCNAICGAPTTSHEDGID